MPRPLQAFHTWPDPQARQTSHVRRCSRTYTKQRKVYNERALPAVHLLMWSDGSQPSVLSLRPTFCRICPGLYAIDLRFKCEELRRHAVALAMLCCREQWLPPELIHTCPLVVMQKGSRTKQVDTTTSSVQHMLATIQSDGGLTAGTASWPTGTAGRAAAAAATRRPACPPPGPHARPTHDSGR